MITVLLAGACVLALCKCLWVYQTHLRPQPWALDHVIDSKPNESQLWVSLLVPVWNDAAVLDRCLDCLVREMRTSVMNTELIVIAGGTDASYQQARAWKSRQPASLRVTVLEQSAQGKNHALNDGVACAHGQILVFVDADTTVFPGWLTELVGPIIRGQAVATTGHFYPYGRTPVSNVFVIEQYLAQVVSRAGNLFGGGTIALARDVWHQIGGFPEEVMVGVDWDLTHRLHQLGFVTCFVHSAQVATEIAESWREFWRGEVRWRRGWWVLQRTFRARLMAIYAVVAGAMLWCSLAALIGAAALPVSARNGIDIAAWAILIWCLGPYVARLVVYSRDSGMVLTIREIAAYLGAACVSSLALLVGLCTRRKLSPHFKGQRQRDVA